MSSYTRGSSYTGGIHQPLPSKTRPTSSSKAIKSTGGSPRVPKPTKLDSYEFRYSQGYSKRGQEDGCSITQQSVQRSHSFEGSSSVSSKSTFRVTGGPKSSSSLNGPRITVPPPVGNTTNKVTIQNEFDSINRSHQPPVFGRRSSSPEKAIGNISKTSSISSTNSSSDRYTPSPSAITRTQSDKCPTKTDRVKLNSNNSNSSTVNSIISPSLHNHKTTTSSVGLPTSAITVASGSGRNQYTPLYTPSSDHTDTKRRSVDILSINKGLVGLRNLGNTCYMNSILQCLSATDILTESLLQKEKELLNKAKKSGIVKAYIDLLNEIWLRGSSMTSIAPMVFKQKVQRLAPMFQGYDQHDSQEFLRFLLSGLHDELNRAQSSKYVPSPSPTLADDNEDKIAADHAWRRTLAYDNSVISELFMGQLKSTLQCESCKNVSVTFDPFWDLSLPIPSQRKSITSSDIIASRMMQTDISLDDCFTLFLQKEKLDNDNKPFCEKCKSLQPATKQLSIQKYPSILVLHLKRFSGVHYRTKLSTLVKFKEDMMLSSKEESTVRYQLYAISNHSGSCYGGHYTAFCKHPVQGKWYQLNDSSVAPVSNPSIVSNQAYVLFYKKISSKLPE